MCVIKCEGVFIKLILYNEWVYSYFSLGALIQEFFPRAAGGGAQVKSFWSAPLYKGHNIY